MADEPDRAPEAGPQIREYADAVWRRRWFVGVLTLAGVAGAALYGAQMADVYAVSTRIDIAKQRPFSVGGQMSVGESFMESQLYYPTRNSLLTSRTYVDRLLRAKDGATERAFPMWDWLTWSAYGGAEPKADAAENLGPAVDARSFEDVAGIDGPTFARRFAFRAYGPPASRRPTSEWADPSALASFLVNRTTVKPEKGTTLVEIDLEGERREVLAPLLNLLVEVFSREQRSEGQRRLEREREFFRQRRAELTNDDPERPAGSPAGEPGSLQVATDRLDAWKHREHLEKPALEETRTQLLSRMHQGDEKILSTTDELVPGYPTLDRLIRREEVERTARAGADAATADVAVDRALLKALADVAARASAMNLDAGEETEFHRLPFVTADKAFASESAGLAAATAQVAPQAVEAHRRQRNRIARDLVLQTVTKYEELLQVRAAKREQRAKDQQELSRVWSLSDELDSLQKDVDAHVASLREVDARLSGIRSQYEVERDTKPLRVIEAATDPLLPVRPHRPLLLLIGGGLALLLGIGVALFLELLDDTVSSPQDVERFAKSPVVGTIVDTPAGSGHDGVEPDRVAALRPRSPVTEAYRALRTAIEFCGPEGQGARILLVTSAAPREGKTTVAANLATVLAQDGKRTLLVDADLRKPRVHTVYGIEGAIGLTNVLVGRASLEDAVVAAEPEGLFLLPCGAIPPNPAELLGRPAAAALFARLAGLYDRVVVDTPPVGVVTDAAVLARHASQTLLVVSAGTTKKRAVAHAASVLKSVGAAPTGVVLNLVRRGSHWLYGSYYQPNASAYYGTHDEGTRSGGEAAPDAPRADAASGRDAGEHAKSGAAKSGAAKSGAAD